MNPELYSRTEVGKNSLRKGYVAEFTRLSEKRAKLGDRVLDEYANGRITEKELSLRLAKADSEFFSAVSDAYDKFKNLYHYT